MMLRKSESNSDSKVIIVGDISVGKTSILSQFNSNVFNPRTEGTIGAVFLAKMVRTPLGPTTLYIWDTAGQERYRSLIPMYSRGAAAALLVIDGTSLSSYESKDNWHKVLVDHCPAGVKIYIVVSKSDLPCQIPQDALQRWSETHSFPLFVTSALDYDSVAAVFVRVASDLIQASSKFVKPERISEPQDGGPGCC
jgi:small GTP-binding protein